MLAVWLPLTKDIRNQGLADLTISGTPVFKNSGKLGGKSLDLNTRVSFTCSALVNLTTFSIAFWAKVNDDSSLSTDCVDVIGFTDATSSGTTGQLRWETCYSSSNKSRGISSHNNATYATSNGFGKLFCDKNVWVHLVCTVDLSNNSVKEYVNGEHLYTYTPNGGHLTGAFWLGQTGVINGEIQDVRIYDHCLSPMEVKELAKGLVLHYPLNRGGWGQENLLLSTPRLYNTTGYNFIQLPLSETLIENQTYTLQLWGLTLDSNSSGTLPFWGGGSNPLYPSGTSYLKPDNNGYLKYTFTVTNANVSHSQAVNKWINLYNFVNNHTGINATLEKWKLEKGSIATPWCPNSSDNLADEMGLNEATEYDCSGFCNNGTKIGTFTYSSDTPKYAVSTQFGSTSTKIQLPIMDFSGMANSYTFAWWQYNTSTGNMPWGFSNGNRLNVYHTSPLCWNTGDGSSNQFKDGSTTITPASVQNAWHHMVVTGDGTSTKLYIDGVYRGTATTYKALTGTQIWISGWDSGTSYTFNGSKECDFRIYATALSASDVKSLYQNCATIDPDGTIRGQIRS